MRDHTYNREYDESPIPDDEHRTARIPGNDRRWLAFGFSYETANNMTVDVGYAHLFITDARINNILESSTPHLNSTLTGTYEDHSDTISAQVTWGF